MGKGGMSIDEHGEGKEENMAAWLVGMNTLKIQPFKLPTLGIHSPSLPHFIFPFFFPSSFIDDDCIFAFSIHQAYFQIICLLNSVFWKDPMMSELE